MLILNGLRGSGGRVGGAIGAFLVLAALIGASGGHESVAAGELAPTDGAVPLPTGDASGRLLSVEEETPGHPPGYSAEAWAILKRVYDPRTSVEEREALFDRLGQIAEAETPAEARGQGVRRLIRSYLMPKKEWPAPLPQLVYVRLLHENDAPEPARVLLPELRLEGPSHDPTDMYRGGLPRSTSEPALDVSLGMGPPSLSELVSDRILYSTREPSALLIAAIELEHNEVSFDLLLKYGLRDYVKVYARSDHGPLADAAVQALAILRAYDPADEARADVEMALQSDIQPLEGEGASASQAAERAKHLKSLLASWDFAQGLSEARRKAYQEYEHRRWMALALTDPRPKRPTGVRAGPGRFAKASALCPWPDGDEDFFLRNFESPASTEEDVRLAGLDAFLQPDGTYRFSDEGIRRLEAVAKGDSFRAKEAARLLPLLKNEKQP